MIEPTQGGWLEVMETGIKRPPFAPTCNNRPLADYIGDWLATNQIKSVLDIYHNPFPIGFVVTCIDRYERAEQRIRELESKLAGIAEAAKK